MSGQEICGLQEGGGGKEEGSVQSAMLAFQRVHTIMELWDFGKILPAKRHVLE